jgi:uncharacterized protein
MGAIALAVTLGVAAGMLAGFFGVGGGILFVPTLALALGLGQLEAEATSLAAILPAAAAGAWQQNRYGNVRWRAAAVIGAASVVGVELGIRVAEALSEDALRRLFALLMLVVAAQVALKALRS